MKLRIWIFEQLYFHLTQMKIIRTLYLDDSRYKQINHLWNEEYPAKLKNRLPLLLNGKENFQHYFIEDENKKVMAWAMVFEKDRETRFSIVTHQNHQGKGLGSKLVEELKKDFTEFYGIVIDHNNDKKLNGEYYQSPLAFYEKRGFEVLPGIRVDNEYLNAVKIRWKRND